MKLINSCIFLFATILLAASAYAKEVDVASLQRLADSYLQEHKQDEHVSALAITITSPDNKQPVSVYSGSGIYDGQSPVTSKSLFQIGSITKSYITAIVLQLEGNPQYHFSIDDPIDKFFPEYSKWHSVTIKQLMNMTSGIPSYTNDEHFFTNLLANPYIDMTPQELIAYVNNKDMLFTPSQKWDYSNTNYILLGLLIEKLTGNSLGDEINRRLIQPLHLSHTYYAPYKPDQTLLRDLVHGYAFRRDGDKPATPLLPLGTDVTDYTLSWGGAAGAVISNSADVATWAQALFTPDKVLNKEQFKKLIQLVSTRTGQPLPEPTQDDPAGFGMGIAYTFFSGVDSPAYAYEGMTLASRGFYIYEPKSGITIAGTLNSSVENVDDHYSDLIAKVYALLK